MAINTLQVAWLSRLASKGVLSPGKSIVEFSPQDVLSPRRAVRQYGLRHNPPDAVDRILDRIYDGESPREDGIPSFYGLFGIEHYRSLDLLDSRVDWICDFNRHVKLRQQFDVATNFGTAEHVFNIGELFRSIHDAIRPGRIALHVLPTFGDIDHGFYNIHPTIYFDLAAANNYTIRDICYVDRWDIRNKILEADLAADFDFDALPIRPEHMKNRNALQRMVTERFVANFNDPDTRRYGASFPGVLYDYCIVALQKNEACAFRLPIQNYYAASARVGTSRLTFVAVSLKLITNIRGRGFRWLVGAVSWRLQRLRKKHFR